jgi:hypothetical protein
MSPQGGRFMRFQASGCGGFLPPNLDALSEEGRARRFEALEDAMGAGGRVRKLLHSGRGG